MIFEGVAPTAQQTGRQAPLSWGLSLDTARNTKAKWRLESGVVFDR
jgi:hypothetical protein